MGFIKNFFGSMVVKRTRKDRVLHVSFGENKVMDFSKRTLALCSKNNAVFNVSYLAPKIF